ncbi:MAG: ABC transporter permease [Lachnospiraceae bacterium]|nr:ABC transporter permease [Lachnospiraceae bacterium]MBP5472407.1 ABC transporter permease [Lachnospiraceae bacterium]MBP5761620.1 ABC transporter permease [Lachnospiraceae bacterium]
MRSKLSAWKYVRNNKGPCAVMITALCLSFMAMYMLYALLQTSVESFAPLIYKLSMKISYASITGSSYGLDVNGYESYEELSAAYDEKQEQLMENLRARDGIDDVYFTQIIMCTYNAVIGYFTFETPLLEADEIPAFLDHMGAELVEGRLPSGEGEMLVDSTIMKNSDYEIGGYFMDDWYGETFRIVGVISSDCLISVGTPMGYTNSGWYIVVLNDEDTADLHGILREEGIALKDSDEVIDHPEYLATYNDSVIGPIVSVVSGVMLAVMIILTIMVMIAYVSFMRNRVSEYCLYASIGYGRSEIYGMILREMLILFGLGSLVGLAVSLIGGLLIHELLIVPAGLIGHLIYPVQIFKILAIFIFIMGMLQLPVLVCLSGIRTIDAVEKE